MTSPSGDTNEAEQPPRLITAPSGKVVGSESEAGSISTPSDLSVAPCSFICEGLHIPPGFSKEREGAFASLELATTAFAVGAALGVASVTDDFDVAVTGEGSGPQPEA